MSTNMVTRRLYTLLLQRSQLYAIDRIYTIKATKISESLSRIHI